MQREVVVLTFELVAAFQLNDFSVVGCQTHQSTILHLLTSKVDSSSLVSNSAVISCTKTAGWMTFAHLSNTSKRERLDITSSAL